MWHASKELGKFNAIFFLVIAPVDVGMAMLVSYLGYVSISKLSVSMEMVAKLVVYHGYVIIIIKI